MHTGNAENQALGMASWHMRRCLVAVFSDSWIALSESSSCLSGLLKSRRADSNRLPLLQLRVSCFTVEREAQSFVLSTG